MGRAGLWQQWVPAREKARHTQREKLGGHQAEEVGTWGQCGGVMLHLRLSQGTPDVCHGKYITRKKTVKTKAGGKVGKVANV